MDILTPETMVGDPDLCTSIGSDGSVNYTGKQLTCTPYLNISHVSVASPSHEDPYQWHKPSVLPLRNQEDYVDLDFCLYSGCTVSINALGIPR